MNLIRVIFDFFLSVDLYVGKFQNTLIKTSETAALERKTKRCLSGGKFCFVLFLNSSANFVYILRSSRHRLLSSNGRPMSMHKSQFSGTIKRGPSFKTLKSKPFNPFSAGTDFRRQTSDSDV